MGAFSPIEDPVRRQPAPAIISYACIQTAFLAMGESHERQVPLRKRCSTG